jgi:hypothetical protein
MGQLMKLLQRRERNVIALTGGVGSQAKNSGSAAARKREVVVYDYVDDALPVLKSMNEGASQRLQKPQLLNR